MNTNLLIGLFVTVLVGGGVYVGYTRMQATQDATVNVNGGLEASQNRNSGPISGTFASLLGLGQNLRCEFAYNDGENVSSGTVYLAQGGARISASFSVDDSELGEMETYLVRDGGYNYMWGSIMEQGIKTSVEPGEEFKLFSEEDGDDVIDENTTYNCVPWSVDQRVFTVPNNIEFIDIEAQMESMLEFQGSVDVNMDISTLQAQQCAACDQIPSAEMRAQCKEALQCS